MRSRPDLPALVRAAALSAGAAGAAAVAAWALVAFVHLDDAYHVDHVTGAWMGLAQAAGEGELYPPLYEDGRYGGTRYMPLGVAVYAAVAEATGEYLVSAKLVGAATLLAILALIWLVARQLGAGRAIALACAGATAATFPAFFAGTTMYGDALPVLLQLAAVAVVLRAQGTRSSLLAGALAGLAVTAKLSAVWGGAAVLVCLALGERRRIPAFVAAAAVTAGAVLGLAELASRGRFSENVVGLAFSGFSGWHALLVDTPQKVFDTLAVRADATLLLLPVALALLVAAAARRSLEVVTLALLPALAVTILVLNDQGTDFNHLLDLAVLTPLVVAAGYGRAGGAGLLRLVLPAVLLLGTTLSLWELRHDVREAGTALVRRETPARYRVPPLAGELSEPFFSEDPGVAVQRGRRPVALDPFMLLRLLEKRPELRGGLVERFDRQEFAHVVLIMDLDLEDSWWSTSHLGLEVARAIDRNYVFERRLPGPVFRYRIYAPRER